MKRKKYSPGEIHQHSRKRTFRLHKRAKLRESIGIIQSKNSLDISLLNVNGYTGDTIVTVGETIASKSPDICILLETKRRKEVLAPNVHINGYETIDRRRSNTAGDRGGGGILMYLRNDKGLDIKEYEPIIDNEDHAFVANERVWVTVHGLKYKTAVCGLYLGFQADDDRHGI